MNTKQPGGGRAPLHGASVNPEQQELRQLRHAVLSDRQLGHPGV
jgi:hypothetical protein